jgi:hypothetical protein
MIVSNVVIKIAVKKLIGVAVKVNTLLMFIYLRGLKRVGLSF